MMTCSTCKHEGRCDGIPGDDCYEPRVPDTEPCPPPEHITFEGDLTVLAAYAQIRRMKPLLPMSTLHLSIDMKAACDGRPLNPELDSSSPACRDMQLCEICWLLAEHFRREEALQ